MPDCKWEFQVCSSPLSPGGQYYPECVDGNACAPVYYYVYLARTGDDNNLSGPYSFQFKELSFTGKLNITPNNSALATAKVLSILNFERSVYCSGEVNDPGNFDSPVFGYDEQSQVFSYYVLSSVNETLTWTIPGRKLLFILAIDAFPGEAIELGNMSGYSVLPNDEVCPNPIVWCSGGVQSKIVYTPQSCSSPFTIRLGADVAYPSPGFPNRRKVPVYVTAPMPANFNIEQLDFLLKIESTEDMAEVFIEDGQVPATDILLYKEPPASSSKNQRAYVKTSNLALSATPAQIATASNTLFYMVMNGPALASECAQSSIRLTDYRRMTDDAYPNDNGCCKPAIGTAIETVDWMPSPCIGDCPKATVSAVPVPQSFQAGSVCENVFINLNISSLINTTYDQAVVEIDINHSGTLAFAPGLTSSAFCSPASACVVTSVPAPGVLRVEFSQSGLPIVLSGGGAPSTLVTLGFTLQDGCIESVRFYDATLHQLNAQNNCIPTVSSSILAGTPDDDICLPSLTMIYKTPNEEAVENVKYDFEGCDISGLVTGQGSSSICVCDAPGATQTITPTKEDDVMAGISTFDLVLISKHLLGTGPLDSPYKIIAADINKSNSVTTFDIVELRKLILMIYPTLPQNTSYRFIDKNQSFSNPANPFASTPFQEQIDFQYPPSGTVAEFVAVKVGDVNWSYQCCPAQLSGQGPVADRATEAAAFPLAYKSSPVQTLEGQNSLELPVFPAENLDAVAWQMALQYDTSRWRCTGVRPGDADPGQFRFAWHEPVAGELRVVGFDAAGTDNQWPAGAPMFVVELSPLQSTTSAQPELALLPAKRLAPELYDTLGAVRIPRLVRRDDLPLVQPRVKRALPAQSVWSASLYPNPSAGHWRLEWRLPAPAACRIVLSDPLGKTLWAETRASEAGLNTINSTQMPLLAPGQYFLRVETPWGPRSLRLVRL